MTRQEALIYLNSNEENWEENLELLIFELKKDLFRRVLIPKLLVKKAEKVAVWSDASQVLKKHFIKKHKYPQTDLKETNLKQKGNLIELYRSFESILIQLQLKLSQSFDAKIVSETINSIADLEFKRQKLLLPLAKSMFIESENKFEVKISEDAQTGVIISELKQFNKEEFTDKKDLLLLPNFKKDLQRILKSN